MVSQLDEDTVDETIYCYSRLTGATRIHDLGCETKGELRDAFAREVCRILATTPHHLAGLAPDLQNSLQIAVDLGYPATEISPQRRATMLMHSPAKGLRTSAPSPPQLSTRPEPEPSADEEDVLEDEIAQLRAQQANVRRRMRGKGGSQGTALSADAGAIVIAEPTVTLDKAPTRNPEEEAVIMGSLGFVGPKLLPSTVARTLTDDFELARLRQTAELAQRSLASSVAAGSVPAGVIPFSGPGQKMPCSASVPGDKSDAGHGK